MVCKLLDERDERDRDMTKVKVNLYDSMMNPLCLRKDRGVWSITNSSTDPQIIEWDYLGGDGPTAVKAAHAPAEKRLITVFTEKDMFSPWAEKDTGQYKVLFMHECRGIHPQFYKAVPVVENKFDFIVTHDEDLLKRGPKFLKISSPGNSFISDENAKIYEKTKLLSHIVSKQNWARGHKLRYIIAEAIKDKYEVDLWGSAVRFFDTKLQPLKDYMFSITVMNCMHKDYFTETLVDTFRCGTIPIFWGCPNVSDYFNIEGMLIFNTGPELISILDSLSSELYKSKMRHVKENFEIAKEHCQIDDKVYNAIIAAIDPT